jgi:hypothetical protein
VRREMGLSPATGVHIGRNEILTPNDEKQTTKSEKNPPQAEKNFLSEKPTQATSSLISFA